MIFQIIFDTNLLNFLQLFNIVASTTALISSVFHTYHFGQRRMIKLRIINPITHLLGGNHSTISVNQIKIHTTIKTRATTFIQVNMRPFITNNLVAWIRMQLYRRLVGHRTTRKKQGCFHPKHLSNNTFKLNYCRILLVHVISYFRLKHKLQHLTTRLSYRIRNQIYFHILNKIISLFFWSYFPLYTSIFSFSKEKKKRISVSIEASTTRFNSTKLQHL